MSIKSTRISSAEGEKIWRETGNITTKKVKGYIGMDSLVSGKTGMKFTCDQDFDAYRSLPYMVYVRLFPASPVAAYQYMENRNTQTYWDRVAMKPQYNFATNRTLFPREAFEQNRIEFDSLTIIQTGKLPKGMRYMVDWRYIGGIPPMRNGRVIATSYRRFLHPVPTSQCGNVCWSHMLAQATAFSRPAQLGERARIPQLGHVPYCPSAMIEYFDSNDELHSRHDVCDAALTQLRIYGMERNGCGTANSNQVRTWGKFTSAETFGLSSEGHSIVIPYIREPNDAKFGVDARGSVPNDDFSEPENFGNEQDALPEPSRTQVNPSWGRSPTCFYKQPYSKNNIDTHFAQFVDKDYRISDGDYLIHAKKPYLCHYNRILMCEKDTVMTNERKLLKPDPGIQFTTCEVGGNGVKPILKKYFVEGGNSWKDSFGDRVVTDVNLKTNNTRLFNEVQLTNSGASYIGSTNGIPLFCGKNQDAHMSGEMSRTSPVLYIMFMLDNYGPLGIHFGQVKCDKKKGEDPNKIVTRLGGVQKSAHIKFYDLLVDGSGDTIDRMARTLPDDVCPVHFNSTHTGTAGGHSVALVGYKFIPSRADSVLLIMFNSHDFSGGDPSMNRGIIVRRVPITSTFFGFNGIQPVPARWNQHALPMKYYYDGSEEVPLGAQGGSNEVRGGSAYDWTQTTDFDKSGKSLANKGDGTDGRHCGLGTFCTVAKNDKTPYIYRRVQQSAFTKTSSRRVLVTYGKKVTCSEKPKTVSRNAAVEALAKSVGISFFVENPGASTVDLFLDVKEIVTDVGTGASVFAISVSDNDNEVFYDRIYDFHMSKGRTLPLCTPFSKDVENLSPKYTSIGSATVCTGGTAVAGVSDEKACGDACSNKSDCDYFSFRYKTATSSAQCFLGCKPAAFDFDKQVCDSVAYKKATDLDADKPRVKVAAAGLLELENRFCKAGQQLFQDFYTGSFAKCAATCTSERFCSYFAYNGSRCSVYAKCNLGISDPYEYDFSLLGMPVPDKGQPVRLYANLNFRNVKTGQIPIEGDIDAITEMTNDIRADAVSEASNTLTKALVIAFPLVAIVILAILIKTGIIGLLLGGGIMTVLVLAIGAAVFYFM